MSLLSSSLPLEGSDGPASVSFLAVFRWCPTFCSCLAPEHCPRAPCCPSWIEGLIVLKAALPIVSAVCLQPGRLQGHPPASPSCPCPLPLAGRTQRSPGSWKRQGLPLGDLKSASRGRGSTVEEELKSPWSLGRGARRPELETVGPSTHLPCSSSLRWARTPALQQDPKDGQLGQGWLLGCPLSTVEHERLAQGWCEGVPRVPGQP